MSIIASDSGGSFYLLPEGTHLGRCVQVLDIGTHAFVYLGENKTARKVRLTWEIPGEMLKHRDTGEERPALASKEYTLSLHEKSALRKDLEAWRGRAFTEEELKGFDLSKLLTQPALLSVVHKATNGRTYANIAQVGKPIKGMVTPPQITPTVEWSVAMGRNETFQELPEWLQEKISKCEEWTNPAPTAAAETEAHEVSGDDDVPF